MLTNAKAAMHLGALVLGTIVVNFSTLSANAQSTTAESFNFEEISAGDESDWNFPSENETVSIQDDLQELEEYDISEVDNLDVRLIQKNRRRLRNGRWGNRGDRQYYYTEDRFFPHYYIENRFYNYY